MDMLKELSTMLGFTFTIQDNPDGIYGRYDYVGGTWSGMIGEVTLLFQDCHRDLLSFSPHIDKVISGTADIALADMTIVSTR